MSRNPHASNLRHHRQQIIADKRERARAMDELIAMDADLLDLEAEREARDGTESRRRIG